MAVPEIGLGSHITDPAPSPWEQSWNQGELRAEKVKRPADMIAVTDSDSDCLDASSGVWDELANPIQYPGQPSAREWPGNRHNGYSNVLFVDTHAEPMLQSVLVKPAGGIRRKWNNDYREHSEFWPDLPAGNINSGS